MKHPIFDNKFGLVCYLVNLAIFFFLLFFIGWYFDERNFLVALVNSACFIFPLLILGACFWYVVRYTIIEQIGIGSFLLHHVLAAIVSIGIWLSSAYHIRTLFFDGQVKNLDYILPFHWQLVIAFFTYVQIVIVYYLVIYYRNFKEKLEHESELKDLVKEAELSALKSQINPHFLFNSLNSVSSLMMTRPDESRNMVVKLSTFLRYSLAQNVRELNSLQNEIDNVRLYLEIEKIRFGDRLQLDFDFSTTCEKLKIPNLILQPLYENAIKYGVHESIEPVTIKTICKVEKQILKIEICNNYDSDSVPPKGNGIGLKNIQERLYLIYNRNDLLSIKNKGNQFTVYLEFPQK